MSLEHPPSTPVRSGWRSLLEDEGRQRLVLVLNHVLGSERVAQQRLQPHAGCRLQLAPTGWPSLLAWVLPMPQPLTIEVTRAGLLELVSGTDRSADLVVSVDTSDPLAMVAQVLSGGTPSLQLQGDAAFAADVNWLAENLRWDVAADIERFFGPVPADKLSTWGFAVGQALKDAVGRLASAVPRR